jgi:hypothetical protein
MPDRWIAAVDAGPSRFDVLRDTPLSWVTGIALTAAGDIAVVDGAEHRLWLFRQGERPLALGGRRGSGPGEFSSPCCVSFVGPQQLLVRDTGNRRYVWLRADSAGLRVTGTTPMPDAARRSESRALVDASGRIQHITQLPSVRLGVPLFRVQWLDATGQPRPSMELLGATPDSVDAVAWQTAVAGGVSTTVIGQPFGSRLLLAELPTGALLRAVSGFGRIERVTPPGRTALFATVPHLGAPLTDAERKEAANGLASVRREHPEAARRLRIPSRKPPLEELGVDEEGRVWVVLSTPAGQPRRARVYAPDGRHVADATLPADIRLVGWALRGSRGVGVQESAGGELSLVELSFSRR